jgi:hypothetical protein
MALLFFLVSGVCFLGVGNSLAIIHHEGFDAPWVHLWPHLRDAIRKGRRFREDDRRISRFWGFLVVVVFMLLYALLALRGQGMSTVGALRTGVAVVAITLFLTVVFGGIYLAGTLSTLLLFLLLLVELRDAIRKGRRCQDDDRCLFYFWNFLIVGVFMLLNGLLALGGGMRAVGPLWIGVAVVATALFLLGFAVVFATGTLITLLLFLLLLVGLFPPLKARSDRWRAALVAEHKGRPKHKRKNDELV